VTRNFLFLLSSVQTINGNHSAAYPLATILVTSEYQSNEDPLSRTSLVQLLQWANYPDYDVRANVELLTFDQFTYTLFTQHCIQLPSNYKFSHPEVTLHAHTEGE
jgi:hypothetical protein